MAVTSAQIVDFLVANPGMSDAQIVAAMEQNGVSPAQMASAVGLPVGDVISRVAATVSPGSSVTLGDTRVTPQYQTIGSGEDQQIGGVENVYVEKTTGDINYKAPVGSNVQVYSPTGEFVNTIKTQKEQSFFGGLVDALKDPVVLAALAGGYGAGLFGGTGVLGGAAGTAGLTAAEIAALTAGDLAIGGGALAGTGLTAAQLGAAGLTASEIAALTAQDLAIGGGGTGALTGGLAAGGTVAGAGGAGTTLGTGLTAGSSLSGLTGGSSLSGLTTGAGTLAGTNTLLGGAGLGTTLAGLGTGVLGSTVGSTLGSTLGSTVGSTLANTAARGLGGLTSGNLANLFSGGLGTAGSLLQMQESREAAQRAQAMIDRETAAAKTAAQFRPIGMTTRFGTSQFQVDPVTGQLTSAGYTLSPEAKAAQDRLVALAGQGLTQAEGAQKAFEPLQTGATRLFELGGKYLAKTPEDVAKDYLASQMALLQPGRELELANLQNRLQQQGRGGLAVAQGGAMGATTPELQALFNARAQQEAQLAANAQQYGQQNVLFGAGLLGQGSQAMGQYYGGQQQAYAPFTTALGQVQGLETAAQQPLQMGAALGQTASTAGARMGQLGLQGAGQSVALATGADATRNLGAQSLIAAGNPNAMFGQALGNMFGGLFGSTNEQLTMNPYFQRTYG